MRIARLSVELNFKPTTLKECYEVLLFTPKRTHCGCTILYVGPFCVEWLGGDDCYEGVKSGDVFTLETDCSDEEKSK